MSERRDLRAYAKTTQIHLILGVILLVFVVGDGLVYLIFGAEAGKFAFVCTGLGLLPLILIFGFLWFLGWIARRATSE